MRNTENVNHVKEDGKNYKYIQFYLPSFEERKIVDHEQYWRDKDYQFNLLSEVCKTI